MDTEVYLKLYAVYQAAMELHRCEDLEETPTHCDKCQAEDMEAYQAVRLRLLDALCAAEAEIAAYQAVFGKPLSAI